VRTFNHRHAKDSTNLAFFVDTVFLVHVVSLLLAAEMWLLASLWIVAWNTMDGYQQALAI
jgi:hypothetical protein